jgi:hypothetical protein
LSEEVIAKKHIELYQSLLNGVGGNDV